MEIENLRDFGSENGIELVDQDVIANEAAINIAQRHDTDHIKSNFDLLLDETEKEAHSLYLEYEEKYVKQIFNQLAKKLIESGEIESISQLGRVLGDHYELLKGFFLSLSQGRRARAGKTFESIQNSLFKTLNYPFEEQKVINGKPDFIMPSAAYFRENAMDCIIYTSKRTLRERWRQIVTEGSQGLGFFLATIDEDVSSNQLTEMRDNRVYLVCPQRIKEASYPEENNVLSFSQFFRDHLDPAMSRWERRGVI